MCVCGGGVVGSGDSKAIVNDRSHKVLTCLYIIRFFFKCYDSFDDYDGETLK